MIYWTTLLGCAIIWQQIDLHNFPGLLTFGSCRLHLEEDQGKTGGPKTHIFLSHLFTKKIYIYINRFIYKFMCLITWLWFYQVSPQKIYILVKVLPKVLNLSRQAGNQCIKRPQDWGQDQEAKNNVIATLATSIVYSMGICDRYFYISTWYQKDWYPNTKLKKYCGLAYYPTHQPPKLHWSAASCFLTTETLYDWEGFGLGTRQLNLSKSSKMCRASCFWRLIFSGPVGDTIWSKEPSNFSLPVTHIDEKNHSTDKEINQPKITGGLSKTSTTR